MGEKQLHLIPPCRPLLERFGAGFFGGVPACPGVYIMTGEGGRVLYIGQSKNLRARLGSYKNALPDRAPRKVIRLIHHVRSIVWEQCGSAVDAQVRENQLLRTHRPRFNRMNTYPQAYGFIILKPAADGFVLRAGRDAGRGEIAFGAFKGGWIAAHGALIRLGWAMVNRPFLPGDFPPRLFQPNPLRQFQLRLLDSENLRGSTLLRMLTAYLAGESLALLDAFGELLADGSPAHPFLKKIYESDLEFLKKFHAKGPARNRRFAHAMNLDKPVIPQECLDDFLVTMKDVL